LGAFAKVGVSVHGLVLVISCVVDFVVVVILFEAFHRKLDLLRILMNVLKVFIARSLEHLSPNFIIERAEPLFV